MEKKVITTLFIVGAAIALTLIIIDLITDLKAAHVIN